VCGGAVHCSLTSFSYYNLCLAVHCTYVYFIKESRALSALCRIVCHTGTLAGENVTVCRRSVSVIGMDTQTLGGGSEW